MSARRKRSPLRVGWAGSLNNQTTAHRGVHELIAPAVAAVEGAELHLAAREDRLRNAEEMREYYQSLHVYVCASRSEGTPNPCLEAAACGVPIVTTPVGNMPEFIRDGENGFLVTRDVDDIAAKLRRLRDDPELRARMGAAARATAEVWDWRHHATHYAEMFEAMLDGRVSGPSRRSAARRAKLRAGEALHVFANGVRCVLNGDRTLSQELFARFVAIACAVDSPRPSSDESPIDLPSAPPELTRLLQRFGRFAESDDDLREQATEALDQATRTQLLAEAAPLLPAIDRYLDSLEEPWPESALRLSWLAEFVAELAVSDSQ